MENMSTEFSPEYTNILPDSAAAGLRLMRRRLIPDECISLPDDKILLCQNDILVTSWKTIRPRKNFDHGFSCYFLKEGYKISKFYRSDDTLLYCYCDIISPEYEKNTNTLTVTDLLADVIIYPNGLIKVVDIDELADAFEQGSISSETLSNGLRILNRLLMLLYDKKLPELLAYIDLFDKK